VRRPLLALAALIALCAGAAAAIISLDGPGKAPTRDSRAHARRFDGPSAPPSMPAFNFALKDQNGRTVRLSDYAGGVVALSFLYSTCTNTCPIIAQQIRGALGELHRPAEAIFVSVDPEQDTRAHVRRFLAENGLSARVEYLAGTRRQLRPIWHAFGIAPQAQIDSHRGDFTVDVELLDKSGKPRVGYVTLKSLDPDDIAHDIETLQDEPPPRTRPARVDL
jgi:protein SCO1